MKKYIFLFLTIVALGILSSCNDQLDLDPDGRITMEQVFSERYRTMGYLNSCYNNYCPEPHMDRSSFCDEAEDADNNTSGSKFINWYSGAVTASTFPNYSVDGSPWTSLYEGIRKCNVFLDNIWSATAYASQEEKQGWAAQAHTLRALYYLQLIKRYGGVPIIDKPLDTDHDFTTDTKSSFSEVVKFILADCDSALAAPATSDGFHWEIYNNQFGMMTRAVTYAIMSEAVTYAASPLYSDGTFSWSDATEINKEALYQCLTNDYELFNNAPVDYAAQNAYALYFLTNSNDQRSVDKETIYQRGGQIEVWKNAGLPTTDGMEKAGPCPTQEMVDCYEMANGEAPVVGYSDADHLQPIINSKSGYDPENPYEGRDPRFYASIYYNGARRTLDPPASAAMKFTASSPFYSVTALCPSWGNSVGNLTFSLYEWNVDYENSVAGTPLYKQVYVNFGDGQELSLSFNDALPAGDYIWVLDNATETVGVWKWVDGTSSDVSYYSGAQVDGNHRSRIAYSPGNLEEIVNGATQQTPVQIAPSPVVSSYVGGAEEISLTNRTHTPTGYYLRKFNNWRSGRNNSADGSIRLFRLAELYLNFAESAYQSEGPEAKVTLGPGMTMSAADAVNAIRARAGMPDFPNGMSKDDFEKKYRNERRVELAFEGHRYFDVRRWKILDETDNLVSGMEITNGESGFTYKRFKFDNRNCSADKWLLYPINQDDVSKVFGISGNDWQNPGWN